jgi:hypothetical protein
LDIRSPGGLQLQQYGSANVMFRLPNGATFPELEAKIEVTDRQETLYRRLNCAVGVTAPSSSLIVDA